MTSTFTVNVDLNLSNILPPRFGGFEQKYSIGCSPDPIPTEQGLQHVRMGAGITVGYVSQTIDSLSPSLCS